MPVVKPSPFFFDFTHIHARVLYAKPHTLSNLGMLSKMEGHTAHRNRAQSGFISFRTGKAQMSLMLMVGSGGGRAPPPLPVSLSQTRKSHGGSANITSYFFISCPRSD